MSTKFPLTLLLMELTEELRTLDLKLDLAWISRGENTKADALSNEEWGDFDVKMREVRRPEEIGWKVLDKLQERSEELYKEIRELKESRAKANLLKRGRGVPPRGKGSLTKW